MVMVVVQMVQVLVVQVAMLLRLMLESHRVQPRRRPRVRPLQHRSARWKATNRVHL